jgi:ribonuclease H2 subunit C
MLAIHPSSPQKTTPNLLPTRIHHNGPINSAARYWTPSTDDKGDIPANLAFRNIAKADSPNPGTQHVHFRGRHLHGTPIALPDNYTGAVLRVTDELAPRLQQAANQSTSQSQSHTDEEDENGDELEEMEVETKIAKQIGEFDEVVIWEHGGRVDEERDGFVRGLREWVGFAERMHVDDEEEEEGEKKGEKKA